MLPSVTKLNSFKSCGHRRILVFSLFLLLSSAAYSQGFEFGISAYPAGVVTAHVGVPLFEARDVQHQARASVAYGFEGLPALGATYVMRDAGRTFLGTYLGAGLGVSFPGEPLSGAMLSMHVLAGMSTDIVGGLRAFTEVVVAGNGLGSDLSLGAGLTYTLGGFR